MLVSSSTATGSTQATLSSPGSVIQSVNRNKSVWEKVNDVGTEVLFYSLLINCGTLVALRDYGWWNVGLTVALGVQFQAMCRQTIPETQARLRFLAAAALTYGLFVALLQIYDTHTTSDTAQDFMILPLCVGSGALTYELVDGVKELWKRKNSPEIILQPYDQVQSLESEEARQSEIQGLLRRATRITPLLYPYTNQTALYYMAQVVQGLGGSVSLLLGLKIDPLTSPSTCFFLKTAGYLIMGDALGAAWGKFISDFKISSEKRLYDARSQAVQNLAEVPVCNQIFILRQGTVEMLARVAGAGIFAISIDNLWPVLVATGFLEGDLRHCLQMTFEQSRNPYDTNLENPDSEEEKQQKLLLNVIGYGASAFFAVATPFYTIKTALKYHDEGVDISAGLICSSLVLSWGGSKAIQFFWDKEKSGRLLCTARLLVCENPDWIAYAGAVSAHAVKFFPVNSFTLQISLVLAAAMLGLNLAGVNDFKRHNWKHVHVSPFAIIALSRWAYKAAGIYT